MTTAFDFSAQTLDGQPQPLGPQIFWPGIATASAAFTRATNSAYCAAYPAFW